MLIINETYYHESRQARIIQNVAVWEEDPFMDINPQEQI